MRFKLLLSVLMLAIIIAGGALLDQEIFRIRAVVVRGCDTRPPEEVTALSQIEYGQSIFQVDMSAVADNVDASPYYRVDRTRRLYPDKVEVVVHERKPRAVVLYLGAFIVMDEEGYILEVRQDKGHSQCPMVGGLSIVTYHIGQQVIATDTLQLKAMHDVLLALERLDVSKYITQIQLDNPLDIRLTTVDGYRVMLGDSDDLDEKFNWLSVALPRLRNEGLYGGTIYLSGSNASYLPAGAGGQASAAQPVAANPDAEDEVPADDLQGETSGEGEGSQ